MSMRITDIKEFPQKERRETNKSAFCVLQFAIVTVVISYVNNAQLFVRRNFVKVKIKIDS